MKSILTISAIFFLSSVKAQNIISYKDSTILDTVKTTVIEKDTIWREQWLYVSLPHDTSYPITSIKYGSHVVKIPVYAPPVTTMYGLKSEQKTIPETEALLKSSNINLVRAIVFYRDNYYSKSVDTYLADGYNVQINFNYAPTDDPVDFPTDTAFIRAQAEKFFAYYKPHINKIPVVAVENEWDNLNYHSNNINFYITELKIVTEVGHKYGFKIADAGFTGAGLQRWTYSKLSGDSAKDWLSKFFVAPGRSDYPVFLAEINTYAAAVKSIPIDYINWHWYGKTGCWNGLQTALSYYLKATGKTNHITNEFGAHDSQYWNCTVAEVQKAAPPIAIAYSGQSLDSKAVELDLSMLQVLK